MPCLMGWPGVSCFTSLGTRDWAETGVGKFDMATQTKSKEMSGADKMRVVVVLLFMVRSVFYFAQIYLTSPRLVAARDRERVARCFTSLLRAAALYFLKQFAQSFASLVQLRLRIPDRASKNSGNLPVFVAMDIVENKYCPVALRQLVHGRLESDTVI